MNYYLLALQKYATFSGRATRSEFWYFFLINVIISIIISVISGFTQEGTGGVSLISSLYNLAILAPSLAIGARRLHDIGKSGWMQLVVLIPLAGFIWLIVLFATKSSPEDNKYGAKNVAAPVV